MKNSILLMLLCLITMSFQFDDKQTFSEKYSVMAVSGLKMRATPNGKQLLTIPYNGKVEKIEAKGYGDLNVEELKDFFIKGEWVKIKYNGKEGFVFSGYLTSFPIPEMVGEDIDYTEYDSEFMHYLQKKFEALGEKYDYLYEDNSDYKDPNSDPYKCGYSQVYSNNILYKKDGCEKGGKEYLKIKGITMIEAYFILRALDVNHTVEYPNNKNGLTRTYNKVENIIYIEAAEAGCYPTIKQLPDNTIEIDMWCGC